MRECKYCSQVKCKCLKSTGNLNSHVVLLNLVKALRKVMFAVT